MWTLGRIVLLLTVAPFALYAQQTNVGAITGTSRDPSGAVVPGVAVVATHQGTGFKQEVVTNDSGVYVMRILPLGMYSLSASKTGFKKVDRVDIPVTSGTTFTADFELPVGEITESVTVTSEAPVLDTTTVNMGTTRTRAELAELPVPMGGGNSRSAAGFIKTMAGVNYDYAGGPDWIQVSRANINGIKPGQFGYQIDGLDASSGEAESAADMISPTPDTVEEVRLTTNTDASIGYNGGVAIAMTLRTGTNKVKGSVYYYTQNDSILTPAKNYFATRATRTRNNEIGFTVGGPVYIPKVYDGRNKTFFFASIDSYHDATTPPQTTTVPTSAMRAGDFREMLGAQVGVDTLGRPVFQGAIYDPLTTRSDGRGGFVRDPFVFNGQPNVIDPARLSSVSRAFQEKILLPTRPGIVQNWVGVANPGGINIKDQLLLKFDHNLTDKHRFSFSYESSVPWFLGERKGVQIGVSGHSSTSAASGWLDPAVGTAFVDDRDSYRYRFSYVWTINSNQILNFRAGITRNPHRENTTLPREGENQTMSATAGLTGTLDPMTPWVNSMPGFFEGGQGAFGPRFGTGTQAHSQRTVFGLDWTWNKGKHNYKFGVDKQVLPYTHIDGQNSQGTFGFSPIDTGLPNFAQTGISWASYLLGEVNSASVRSVLDTTARAGAFSFYGQDSWRVTSKLTLNYGLRWDIFTPMIEADNKIATFDRNVRNPGAGGNLGAVSFYGEGAGRNGLRTVHDYYYKALGPRIGLAYAPNPKTVIRANYGINYYPMWQKYYTSTGAQTPTNGFAANVVVNTTNQLNSAFNWNNGFPGVYPPLPNLDPSIANNGSIRMVDRSQNRPPQVQNFGFEIGRELPGRFALRVGYVGTMGHRLPTDGWNINAMPLQYTSLGNLLNANINSAAAQAAGIPLPYPGFNGSVAQALRPYPQFNTVNVAADQYGNSTYNALQVNVQKQFGDLVFLANYTVSKSLTNTEYPGFLGFGGGDFQHPDLRDKEGKFIDAKDRPQILNLSWVYQLPFGRGKRFLGNTNRVVDAIVGGWGLSATQVYESGTPFKVSGRQSIPGIGAMRTTLLPGEAIQLRGCGDIDPNDPASNRYINVNAFRDPAPFTLGNFRQPGDVRNCGILNEDFGIQKDLVIHPERMKIRMGMMVQNGFNRHNWTGLQLDVGNPAAFGRITGTTPARTFQFFARLEF